MAQSQARLPDIDSPDRARQICAGLDEAGRGCLAGPVVAGAVILRAEDMPKGIKDSKKLSAKTRGELAGAIKQAAAAWSVGVVWPARIDAVNILNATLEAMCKAARCLYPRPDMLLIDGNRTISCAIMNALWPQASIQPRQKTIIRGDALVPSISAASIIAKTFRDRLMTSLSRRWPGYGFEKHKGYGTADHLAAIASLGPCPMHRRTFRGVK